MVKKHCESAAWPSMFLCGVLAAVLPMGGCMTRDRYAAEVAAARVRASEMRMQELRREAPGGDLCLTGGLALAEACRLALEHNRDLQAARREREIARGRVWESYSAALPNASASATYTRLDEVSSMNIGGQSMPMGFVDNYEAGFTVRQPLFHGGAISAALRAAQLYAAASDETVQTTVQNILSQTAKAYCDVLLAQQLTEVATQALQFAEGLLKDTANKRQNGLAADYDVLRAEVEVSNARAEWLRRKNALDLAWTQLLKTIGVSQASSATLTEKLVYLPQTATLPEMLELAQQRRPELLQAEYNLRLQREALRVAQSAYWPQVDAFFSYEYANPDPHASTRDEWGDAWRAGASAALPIFDGFARRGRLIQERARLAQVEVRLQAQEEAVAWEVREAVLTLQNAAELAQSQALNLQRAAEGFRQVQVGYRQGVKTQVDVLDAQTALTRARALHYEALHGHVLARLKLLRAVGTLDLAGVAAIFGAPENSHDLAEISGDIAATGEE